jgi:hypothetical protein
MRDFSALQRFSLDKTNATNADKSYLNRIALSDAAENFWLDFSKEFCAFGYPHPHWKDLKKNSPNIK